MKKESENILLKYVPEASITMLMELLRSEKVELKIKNPRITKFGDYRFPDKNGRHRISINANLNMYAFLITLLHEMAHLKAFKKYGRNIKPHGVEWQQYFLDIAGPFINAGIFPEEIAKSLVKSLHKGHSSSCTDLDLYRSLKLFDKKEAVHVEDLPEGTLFRINSMIFKKGSKARKRYKCLNTLNGREYMVHALAEVQIVEPQNIHKSA